MRCRVCGREFDPRGFQVVVPGLEEGFDRVECALEASALGPPPAVERPARPAVLKPLPAAPVAAFAGAGASARPPLLVGGNIALLAAGTAVTIYLWLRVFGVDLAPLGLTSEGAAQPYGRTVVPAQIDLTPAVTQRPEPESTVRGEGGGPATETPTPGAEPGTGGGGSSANGGGGSESDDSDADQSGSKPGRGSVARPQPTPTPPPTPPAEPEPPRTPSAPAPSKPPKPDRPGIPTPGGPDRPPSVPGNPGGGQPDRPGRPPGQSPLQETTRGS